MTPDELALLETDLQAVLAEPDAFAIAFYEVMFELAPASRSLFPDDLTAQRVKLVDELGVLVQAVTTTRDQADLQDFVARGRELGARHVGYGVHRRDYDVMGQALLAALGATLPTWDAPRLTVWTKLYRLITDVMCEGAATEPTTAVPR